MIMIASCIVSYYQDSIAGAWKFLIAIGAGTGSVLILRWFWWRINAWSEVFAMAASFFVSLLPADLFQNEQRRSAAVRVDRPHHGFLLYRDLACGHLCHRSGKRRRAARFLSPRAARRILLGA